MVEPDTIKLLRECNAGIKMGISSLDDVTEKVSNEKLKKILSSSKSEHKKLQEETDKLLNEYSDEGKEPNPIAKGMSHIKTAVMINMKEDTDKEAAKLICDGCNMGIQSLSEYLNKYKAAEEKVKDIAKKIIKIEDELAHSLREFL